jgi:predicted Fe-Mo cluster-binding NifX family protein
MNFTSISNESLSASGGAGIKAAQTIAKTGADIVITGNIGPNAFQTLQAAGIKVITGANGYVKEVIKRYNNGEYKETNTPSVGSHFGSGNSRG